MSDMSITELFDAALQMGASDVFVTEDKVPSIRLHGEIRSLKQGVIGQALIQETLSQVLNDRQMVQLKEMGDLDFGFNSSSGKRFRVNASKQQGKLSLVARPLPSGHFSFEELGLPNSLQKLIDRRNGIVLVTGATGSGKSTTLSSFIHWLNQNKRYHIVSIEDPIEFVHSDLRSKISQREVGQDTISFHEGLKRVVRQSPDVIMIGEMRDKESIEVAMAAALTGHLVLATLHTIDASQTLQRLMSYFPKHLQQQVAIDLSLSLSGIVSQRLIPKSDGSGRILAMEVMTNTPGVSQLLREINYAGLEDLIRNSRSNDLFCFNESLVRLIQQGKITAEIATTYSTNPDELQLRIQGMGTANQSFAIVKGESIEIPNIKKMLQMTLNKGASDLHLTAGRVPLIRVNGELQPLISQYLYDSDMRMLLSSIMNGRQRMVYELEKEVDFSLALDVGQRFRVNAYYQRGSMAAALRVIPSEIPKPESMQIPAQIMQFAQKPHGLILVVGPTGSGKSTTLACMIDRINNSRACRIITVEDPIEFTHRSVLATIDQREVYADTKSFASALKYILRQDPDVVLVGEMRDQETIASALTAAETGHLVFATLHTNDAVQTIDRIIDVFPSLQQTQIRSQLAASLQVVISQRLLKHHSGEGRVPAFEIMVGTHAIRNLIRDNRMHQALGTMESSRAEGMVTMDRAIQDLYKSGQISKEEAMRFVSNPNMFQKL